ncbi:MAG: hypothetical protein H0T49_08225, partial [Chloroflexia bacterium]|nr:hypothetical protein [Chloroflexia bacterium]
AGFRGNVPDIEVAARETISLTTKLTEILAAHSAENARVAADPPAGAVPPAEREGEAQGRPDQGGVFADPET